MSVFGYGLLCGVGLGGFVGVVLNGVKVVSGSVYCVIILVVL